MNRELIEIIKQFDEVPEVKAINGLWNTLQECKAALSQQVKALDAARRKYDSEFCISSLQSVSESTDGTFSEEEIAEAKRQIAKEEDKLIDIDAKLFGFLSSENGYPLSAEEFNARYRVTPEPAPLPQPVAAVPQYEQVMRDAINTGTGIMKDGKRISPEDFYAQPVSQDVEEFIRDNEFFTSVANPEDKDGTYSVSVYDLRAWMAGHARVPVGKQKPYECFTIEGDTWFESPNDIELVHGRSLGEEFQLLAGWCAENVSYRVTKVPDENSDDYEVELLTASKEPHNE